MPHTPMLTFLRATCAALCVALSPSPICAAEPADSLARQLREVQVTTSGPRQGVRYDATTGRVTLSSQGLLQGMRTLGEADAIKTLMMLPGVSAQSDYSSGVSIDGSSFGETGYTFDGAPVLFPYHFGGIFSTFNTPHIKDVTMWRGQRPLSSPAFTGGIVEVTSVAAIPPQAKATVEVGMLASSLTLQAPVTSRLSVAASVRSSYINTLYGWLFDTDDTSLRYGLTDTDITVNWQPDTLTRVKANWLGSNDRLKFIDSNYGLDTRLRWRNNAGSLSWWRRYNAAEVSLTAFVSHFGDRLSLEMPHFALGFPASTLQWGASAEVTTASPWSFGARVELSRFRPQTLEGSGTMALATSYAATIHTTWGMGAARWRKNIAHGILDASVRMALYGAGGTSRLLADPSLTWEMHLGGSNLSFTAQTATQPMHQVGFSQIGMASNFWYPAVGQLKPQRAAGLTAQWSHPLWSGALQPSVSVYGKRVWHDAEYDGEILQMLQYGYYAGDYIVASNGYNVGANVMLRGLWGPFSGWASYSLGICRRKFPESPHRYLPATHEPMHQLKLTAGYRISRAVDVAAHFSYASGRPVTPVRTIYFLAGNIIADYGARNSDRLPAYHRLDLSATWHLTPLRIGHRKATQFINFSIINVYGRRNVEIQHYTVSEETMEFNLKQTSSLFRFMPSLSYTFVL